MGTEQIIRGRLAELLAAEAANDLSDAEREELERLLAPAPAERDQLMRTAGLAQVAFLHGEGRTRPLPAALRERLAKQGTAWQAERQAGAAVSVADLDEARQRRDDGRRVPGPAPEAASTTAPALQAPTATRGATPARGLAGLGWYAAAAAIVVALLLRLVPAPPGTTATPMTPEAQRAALVESATDLVRVAWAPSTEAGYEGASGDVVWSSARQEGYLRLAGLPANDAAQGQYQLWVVDPERDARPVDGGVFDVGSAGEVVIPVQAKLRVGQPAAFAITLEKPGGVVVSDGPMLLVAAVGYGDS